VPKQEFGHEGEAYATPRMEEERAMSFTIVDLQAIGEARSRADEIHHAGASDVVGNIIDEKNEVTKMDGPEIEDGAAR
jgi:hypothetical protein